MFQRGDQGAARSAGGGRGSGGSALRGAATAGGELHHPLRYGVFFRNIDRYKTAHINTHIQQTGAGIYAYFQCVFSLPLKVIINNVLIICSGHVQLKFDQKGSKCILSRFKTFFSEMFCLQYSLPLCLII